MLVHRRCVGAALSQATRPRELKGRHTSRTSVTVRNQDLARHFSALNAELQALQQRLEQGSGKTSAPSGQQQKIKIDEEEVLYCDENGCVLLDRKNNSGSSTPSGAASLNTLLKGDGWLLGRSDVIVGSAGSSLFSAVVGGNGWTVSLTQAELDDLVLALLSIRRTVRDLLLQGSSPVRSPTDPLKVKWDTTNVVMEAICYGATAADFHQFEATFRIGAGRAVNATWSADTVGEVLDALDTWRQEVQNPAQPNREAATV